MVLCSLVHPYWLLVCILSGVRCTSNETDSGLVETRDDPGRHQGVSPVAPANATLPLHSDPQFSSALSGNEGGATENTLLTKVLKSIERKFQTMVGGGADQTIDVELSHQPFELGAAHRYGWFSNLRNSTVGVAAFTPHPEPFAAYYAQDSQNTCTGRSVLHTTPLEKLLRKGNHPTKKSRFHKKLCSTTICTAAKFDHKHKKLRAKQDFDDKNDNSSTRRGRKHRNRKKSDSSTGRSNSLEQNTSFPNLSVAVSKISDEVLVSSSDYDQKDEETLSVGNDFSRLPWSENEDNYPESRDGAEDSVSNPIASENIEKSIAIPKTQHEEKFKQSLKDRNTGWASCSTPSVVDFDEFDKDEEDELVKEYQDATTQPFASSTRRFFLFSKSINADDNKGRKKPPTGDSQNTSGNDVLAELAKQMYVNGTAKQEGENAPSTDTNEAVTSSDFEFLLPIPQNAFMYSPTTLASDADPPEALDSTEYSATVSTYTLPCSSEAETHNGTKARIEAGEAIVDIMESSDGKNFGPSTQSPNTTDKMRLYLNIDLNMIGFNTMEQSAPKQSTPFKVHNASCPLMRLMISVKYPKEGK